VKELTHYVTFSTLVLVLDLCGTFVFALSGAVVGISRRFDIFGVLVLSFVAANSGGVIRDVLIGAVPPPGIADWRYIAVPLLAGLATFYWGQLVERLHDSVQIFDAAGLALFAVSGAQKALEFHLGPVPAVALGMLTGIGGGVVRDIVADRVPGVLRGQIYAVAALAGAAVVVVGHQLRLPGTATTIVGALLCFGIRFFAIRRRWRLPVAGESARSPDKSRHSLNSDADRIGSPR